MNFRSQIINDSSTFKTNRDEMLAKVNELRELEMRPMKISEEKRERMLERGQLTPRERLARLLDPGLPFVQLHSIAGYMVDSDTPEKSIPGSSMIVGIGFVSGARCIVWVDDAGIKAGAVGAMTIPVCLSILDVALKQKLPVIHLVESAGANLMEYSVNDWAQGGKVFCKLAHLSAAGIPTLAILHGAATAGGAYMPGMSDYVVGVKKNGLAALAGSALVQAATGEKANERELGGAEMHAEVSGLVEFLAEDDAHAIEVAKQVVSGWEWNRHLLEDNRKSFVEPLLSPDDLAGTVPVDYRTPYDSREVVARVVDGSHFTDFKPDYGSATLCLKGKINGIPVGIVANNGPIDPDGATKAAQFIQLCDKSDSPLIFLSNTTGFMVGTDYEQKGMVKHGSKLIQAVSNTSVPRITLYIGASFGAGNYGMSGYAYSPDFLFAWPNSMSGVMGGDQAAMTMDVVAKGIAKRKGIKIPEEQALKQSAKLKEHFDRQHTSFYTSGRCLDHGIIDPRDTRKILGFCLETCLESKKRRVKTNSFGISRF